MLMFTLPSCGHMKSIPNVFLCTMAIKEAKNERQKKSVKQRTISLPFSTQTVLMMSKQSFCDICGNHTNMYTHYDLNECSSMLSCSYSAFQNQTMLFNVLLFRKKLSLSPHFIIECKFS